MVLLPICQGQLSRTSVGLGLDSALIASTWRKPVQMPCQVMYFCFSAQPIHIVKIETMRNHIGTPQDFMATDRKCQYRQSEMTLGMFESPVVPFVTPQDVGAGNF
jgi:hypothetical protein